MLRPALLLVKLWQFVARVEYLGIAAQIASAIKAAFPDPLAWAVVNSRYKESDIYRCEDALFDALAPLVGLKGEQIEAACNCQKGDPAAGLGVRLAGSDQAGRVGSSPGCRDDMRRLISFTTEI